MNKSNIFIISGPSGAGEDSIIEGLGKLFEIERIITTTTRPMRTRESEGNPYYFISPEKFQQKIAASGFAEYAQEYNNNFYGITKTELGRVEKINKISILKIEYKGVMAIKKIYPEITSIFINAPSLEILASRIRRRDHASEEFIKERLAYTQEWLEHTDIYDYKVINHEGKLQEAIQEVAQIIKKHFDDSTNQNNSKLCL